MGKSPDTAGSYAAYLHPAQDEDEQPPHPEPLDVSEDGEVDDLPMPNFDRRFSVFCDPHVGQTTSGFDPNTSFSKQQLHCVH
jgi:hypothetical protein